MKSKVFIFSIATIFFALGFIIGCHHTEKVWTNRFLDHAYTEAANQSHFYIDGLMLLRQSNVSNAVELLESGLDGSLLTFLGYETMPPEDRNVAGLRAIKTARKYRTDYPRKNATPGIEEEVQNVLSLLD